MGRKEVGIVPASFSTLSVIEKDLFKLIIYQTLKGVRSFRKASTNQRWTLKTY